MCAVFILDTALRIFLCGHSRTWPARLHALSQKPWTLSIGHIAGQIVRSCIAFSSCAPADAPTRLHSGCTRLYPCHSDVGDGVMADHRPPQRRKLSEALTDRRGNITKLTYRQRSKLEQALHCPSQPRTNLTPSGAPPSPAASGSADPRPPRPSAARASRACTAPTRSDRAEMRSSGTGRSKRSPSWSSCPPPRRRPA